VAVSCRGGTAVRSSNPGGKLPPRKPVAFLRTKADRLLDDVMYNSGIDDEQTAKQHLYVQIQDAFQRKVVAPYGPHQLFLISARQLRLARFDEIAFFEYIRHAAARRQFT